jgi:hypothetical protein
MKPIIFSTLMVQAILDGRKTQTRRVIKPQPAKEATQFERFIETVDCGLEARFGSKNSSAVCDRKPQYKPGDILWVRETFCEVPYEHNHVPIKGGHITIPKYAYKADSERDYTGIWKPSIHMPREAARIFLRVKTVRVERLQDITEEDAIAEGMSKTLVDGVVFISTKGNFHVFWDSLNIKRGYGWDTNPWVWVIEFERINKE